MGKEKIAITIDEKYVNELDRLVSERVFSNRSQAIQEAVSDKLQRLKRSRLAMECAKLDASSEMAMVEEGLGEDFKKWPQY